MSIVEKIINNFLENDYQFTDEDIIDMLLPLGYEVEEIKSWIKQIRKIKEIVK